MSNLTQACVSETFSPSIFGTEILAIEANLVKHFSQYVPAPDLHTSPAIDVRDATFCNVTVSYTHPGQDDKITAETWLPVGNWNGIFKGIGGGGWSPGRSVASSSAMAAAMGEGYATVSTDAGVAPNDAVAAPWALLSPGNVDLYAVQNFGSSSLNEAAIIGKDIVESFYGKAPEYSYFEGCSHGGRQGLMLAQRYPTAYDGIAASAPANRWTDLFATLFWPYQSMVNLGVFPHRCEFDAIFAGAVSACDDLDGVVDGVISDPEECLKQFDPFDMVGSPALNCTENGKTIHVSKEAATVIQATWKGVTTESGRQVTVGMNPGADLTSGRPTSSQFLPILSTTCSGNGTCTGTPLIISLPWYQIFLGKDPEFDVSSFTHAEFDDMVHAGQQQFRSALNAEDPDLSRFKEAGGKMISYHGLDDPWIPPKGTEKYYDDVTSLDPKVYDFYRYFEVPGLSHCYGGPSSTPEGLFAQLRAWVENGTAPESTPVKLNVTGGEVHDRILCPYPQRAKLNCCDDAAEEKCWSCAGEL